MWFLLKAAFWLTLVLLVLPIPEEQRRQDVSFVSTGEAVGVLGAALADLRGFCQRNPEACATGATAIQSLGYKAQAGARMLHDFIGAQLDGQRAPATARPDAPRPATVPGSTDTLSERDREPQWRAPATPPAPAERRV